MTKRGVAGDDVKGGRCVVTGTVYGGEGGAEVKQQICGLQRGFKVKFKYVKWSRLDMTFCYGSYKS